MSEVGLPTANTIGGVSSMCGKARRFGSHTGSHGERLHVFSWVRQDSARLSGCAEQLQRDEHTCDITCIAFVPAAVSIWLAEDARQDLHVTVHAHVHAPRPENRSSTLFACCHPSLAGNALYHVSHRIVPCPGLGARATASSCALPA